jgi:hypothetical protein
MSAREPEPSRPPVSPRPPSPPPSRPTEPPSTRAEQAIGSDLNREITMTLVLWTLCAAGALYLIAWLSFRLLERPLTKDSLRSTAPGGGGLNEYHPETFCAGFGSHF